MTSRVVAAWVVSVALSGMWGWRIGAQRTGPTQPPAATQDSARPTELSSTRPFGSAVIDSASCGLEAPSDPPTVASTSTAKAPVSPGPITPAPSVAPAERDSDQLQAMVASVGARSDGDDMQRIYQSNASDTMRLLAFESLLGPLSGDPEALRQTLAQGMASTSAAVRAEARQRLDAMNNNATADAAAGF